MRRLRSVVEVLKVHGSPVSQILRTLDISELSDDDVACLLGLKPLNWAVLNESVCRSVISVRRELGQSRIALGELSWANEQQREVIGAVEREVDRERDLTTANSRKVGGEKSRQERTIGEDMLEIEELKAME